MSCPVQIQYAEPPASLKWAVDYMRSSTAVVNACKRKGVGIFRGQVPPGVDDTDLIWLREREDGAPTHLLSYFSGRWRQVGAVFKGARVIYNGPLEGIFDLSTGAGIPGGDADGWQIIYDAKNRFIVAAESYNGSQWVSSVDGSVLAQGQSVFRTLLSEQVPRLATGQIEIGYANASGSTNTSAWTGVLYGTVGTAGSNPVVTPLDATIAEPFKIIPPFYASVLVEYKTPAF